MNYVVIIPALEPEQKLVSYINELLSAGIKKIIVVNDGSSDKCTALFDSIAKIDGCHVLTHDVNMGKGAAIKTALKFYMSKLSGFDGVITADCDGQHCVSDVMRLCEAMDNNPDSFVLGCRDFGDGTPGRSLAGNRITSLAMKVFYGISLSDTQTGLRGLPSFMIEPMSRLSGNRYEYELNMLIYAKSHCIPFVTLTIETIYFDNNSGSHYRTVIDSARIFARVLSGLVCFSASAVCSGVLDILIYKIMVDVFLHTLPLSQRLLIAAVAARAVSSTVNFMLNRRLPHVQNTSISSTAPKYYTLLICQLTVSYLCVLFFCSFTGFDSHETLVKIIVDAVLALASYQVQLRWVFCNKTNDKAPKKEELV